MFGFIHRKRQRKIVARRLYESVAVQSRVPSFYENWGVPDTIDGRFELLSLHGFIVWNRVQEEGREGRMLAQAFFDVMFREMEYAARNAGVGDLSVPRHIKKMMKAFKGRVLAYHEAFCNETAYNLKQDVLSRNLYGTLKKKPDTSVLKDVSDYIGQTILHFETLKWDDIKQGRIGWGGDNGKEEQRHGSDARMVA